MLVRDEKLVPPLTSAVALLHTTSPSYLLMASLEQGGAWLANEGEMVMQQGARRIVALEAAAASWQNLAIERDSDWRQDPFKLYLTSAHASGETIARLLDARGACRNERRRRLSADVAARRRRSGAGRRSSRMWTRRWQRSTKRSRRPAICARRRASMFLSRKPGSRRGVRCRWKKQLGRQRLRCSKPIRQGFRCCFLVSASRRGSSMPGQRRTGTPRRALRCSTTREKAYIIGSSHSAPRVEMQGGL